MASRSREPSPNGCMEVDVLFTEIALSFDHILEQIFNSLDSKELLTCRLVCHRWLSFAQQPLQKQIKFTFNENKKCPTGFYRPVGDMKYLTELTNLLKQGQSLPDSEDNGHTPIQFPCNRFQFYSVSTRNKTLQEFLNTYGQNILELKVDTAIDGFIYEYVKIDEIGNLLFNQFPNVKVLHLHVDGNIRWKNKNKDPNNHCLQTTDPEYQEICQKALDLLRSKRNPSLKVLRLGGQDLATILEFIIRISPHLEEIQLHVDEYNWLRYHKCLLEPENRLSLLKEFCFYLDDDVSYDDSSVDTMEKLSFGNFRLRNFKVFFYATEWIQEHPDYEPRIADMIDRILKGSWDTLEEIGFEYDNILRGMRFPDVMPKVRKLIIRDCSHKTHKETFANWNKAVFPKGLNFQTTFPKLSLIYLQKNSEANNVIMNFSRFLNSLNFGADPLSTNVRRVTLSSGRRSDVPTELISPLISQMIQEWFPNASIHEERI